MGSVALAADSGVGDRAAGVTGAVHIYQQAWTKCCTPQFCKAASFKFPYVLFLMLNCTPNIYAIKSVKYDR